MLHNVIVQTVMNVLHRRKPRMVAADLWVKF